MLFFVLIGVISVEL